MKTTEQYAFELLHQAIPDYVVDVVETCMPDGYRVHRDYEKFCLDHHALEEMYGINNVYGLELSKQQTRDFCEKYPRLRFDTNKKAHDMYKAGSLVIVVEMPETLSGLDTVVRVDVPTIEKIKEGMTLGLVRITPAVRSGATYRHVVPLEKIE